MSSPPRHDTGSLFAQAGPHPSTLIKATRPAYKTTLGAFYCADSLELMRKLPDACVNLVLTSPPYALHFKKEYGNVDKRDYVDWFLPFGQEIKRVLANDGSFILNIGGSYNSGSPTRSLYHFKLLIALCDEVGFHLAQECFWFNPAKLPAPAEWVNVRRIRIKDSVEYVWWLSPSETPYADNREVLAPYSSDMKRLIKRGYRAKKRPSGHEITSKFRRDHGGSIPTNVVRGSMPEPLEAVDERPYNMIERGNNESNSDYIRLCEQHGQKAHPARFPAALPEFFIKFLTREGDLVLDPFAGSNTTGRVAEDLERRWLGIEVNEDYVRNSALRFNIRSDRLRL